MVQKAPPEYIPLNFYESSSSESEDDGYEPGGIRIEEPKRKASRHRYFADIVAARARASALRKEEEPSITLTDHDEEPEKTPYQRKVTNAKEAKTIEEFIDNLLPPELKGTLTARKEEPLVDNPSPYPPKYETEEARLKLVEREVLAWCGGRGILPPPERLKPDSFKFVNGELDAPFEVCLSRIVPVEAKAAKRRFKKQNKKLMELERARLDGLLMDDIEKDENMKEEVVKEEDMEEIRDSSVSGAELEALNQAHMDELAAVEIEDGEHMQLERARLDGLLVDDVMRDEVDIEEMRDSSVSGTE